VSKDRRFVPPSETTTPPSDVLSESTDLNALLTALLGQDSTAPSPQSSDVAVIGDRMQASGDDASDVAAKAPPVPSLSPSPPSLSPSRHGPTSPPPAIDWVTTFPSERSHPAVDSSRDFGPSDRTLVSERSHSAVDSSRDFDSSDRTLVSEPSHPAVDSWRDFSGSHQTRVAAQGFNPPPKPTPVIAAIVQPPRTALQQRRGFLSRGWPLVAIGSVVMLVTLSAISKRGSNDATPTTPDSPSGLKTPSSPPPVSPAATTPSLSGPLSSATAQVPPIPPAEEQAATTVKRPVARTERPVRTLRPQRPAASANASRNDPQSAASVTTATESESQSARSAADGSTTASPIDVAPVQEQSSAAEARLPNSMTPAASTPEPNVAAASQIELPAPSAAEVSASTNTAPSSAATPRATAPRLLSGGVPEYLNALRAARVGGTVQVRITIDATGRVAKAESVSGPRPLREAAEQAVRQWRYQPATRNGAPIDSETMVSFTFVPNRPSRP
jgi:protein TonB